MGQLNTFIAKKIINERTHYTLDILSTEYTQQAFTDSSRSFTECVQGLWAILHNDDNEME